jgi:hypothetical protein
LQFKIWKHKLAAAAMEAASLSAAAGKKEARWKQGLTK